MELRLIYLNNIPIYVRIAADAFSREQGLMGIANLEPNEGCLFAFEQDTYTSFWMKNCRINLQAATILESGEIIDIHDMLYTDPYYIHKSSRPVRYVLEMPEKFFTNHNIKSGDFIEIEY